jgi:long-chain acyl-CoA synthetase
MLGGNVRVLGTASAPINPDIMKFLKVSFCAEMIEGYGMTESCGGSVGTVEGETSYGHVGGPNAGVKIRLKDVPEMNYYHTNTPP